MINTIHQIYKKYSDLLGANDAHFFWRVYRTNPKTYSDRLKAINYIEKNKILDAGCGFGQWSIQLSKLNENVHAIDLQPERIIIFNEIVRKCDIQNISIKRANLGKLPYEDSFFDAIFCYGTIFRADWKKAITEFARVTKKGGKVYFSANDIGWFLNLWKNEPNKTEDYLPKDIAAKSFQNTIDYLNKGITPSEGQILIEREECIAFLKENNFDNIIIDGDGKINLFPKKITPISFFKSEYEGLPGCYEVLAELR